MNRISLKNLVLLEAAGRLLSICGYCQKENHLEPQVKKAEQQGIDFSHGCCVHHAVEILRGIHVPEETIQAKVKKIQADPQSPPPPYLKENPELLKQYEQGNFESGPFKS